ncbi:MAG: trypsin-like serine protease [Acidobacteria bacterium]|nr:trypsin-like serine protease [Acidobacteriota bacterium]
MADKQEAGGTAEGQQAGGGGAPKGFGPDRAKEVLGPQGGAKREVFPPQTVDAQPIVGGEPTTDFPDCCAVGSDEGFYCTGTLIAPNLVVTARHCTDVTRVFLKGSDVSKPEQGLIVEVLKEVAHPEYDIRFLVLKSAVDVKPRRVARGSEVGNPKEALAVGFGTIDTDGEIGYGIKRKVKVPIASVGCSSSADVKKFGCNQGKEVVAGHKGLLKDSCRGDSGGPLYIKNSQGSYSLLGATSRGLGNTQNVCGDGGIYVRVDQFLDWVHEQTGIKV